jgi:hypothetical protein
MVYDPGALNASLAAAVGNDLALMAELREAFIESVARQLDLMGRARCDANWELSASRLKSLAASFGAVGMMALRAILWCSASSTWPSRISLLPDPRQWRFANRGSDAYRSSHKGDE